MSRPRRLHGPLLAALALVVLVAVAAAQAQEVRRVLGTEHLRILYRAEHEELAAVAGRAGDTAMARLRTILAAEPPDRVEVYIVRSQAEFDELTGSDNKPWIIGRALPSALRVVVKPMGTQRLPKLVAHELAHVMLDVAMGEAAWTLPRWLHEGIAKYAADDFDEADGRSIARASMAGDLLTIDELEAAFAGDREQVSLAYAQSYTLVAYLSDLEPAKGIRPLLDQLGKGRDVRLALGLAFGEPVPEMEREWLAGLRRGYLPYLAPPASETIVGVLFVVAFVIALVVMRRRSARIRRRMDEEERLRKLLSGKAAASPEGEPGAGDDAAATGDEFFVQ